FPPRFIYRVLYMADGSPSRARKFCLMADGSVHDLVDINGSFQPVVVSPRPAFSLTVENVGDGALFLLGSYPSALSLGRLVLFNRVDFVGRAPFPARVSVPTQIPAG